MSDALIRILAAAAKEGYGREQRHHISENYHAAWLEYKRMTHAPSVNDVHEMMAYKFNGDLHAAMKVRCYLESHTPEFAKEVRS